MKIIEFGELHAEYINGENKMMLLKPFTFKLLGKEYTIPMGFVWDGASIPKPGYIIVGTPFDKYHRRPSLMHDWAYNGNLKKFVADIAYGIGLFVEGLKKALCVIEYAAVAVFGGSHYKK